MRTNGKDEFTDHGEVRQHPTPNKSMLESESQIMFTFHQYVQDAKITACVPVFVGHLQIESGDNLIVYNSNQLSTHSNRMSS